VTAAVSMSARPVVSRTKSIPRPVILRKLVRNVGAACIDRLRRPELGLEGEALGDDIDCGDHTGTGCFGCHHGGKADGGRRRAQRAIGRHAH